MCVQVSVGVCCVCVSICVCLGQCLPFIRNVYLAQHTSYELRSVWAASRPLSLSPFLFTCISFALSLSLIFSSFLSLPLPLSPSAKCLTVVEHFSRILISCKYFSSLGACGERGRVSAPFAKKALKLYVRHK